MRSNTLLKTTGAHLLVIAITTSRILPVLALAAALAGGALAQQNEPKAGMPPSSGHSEMMSGNLQMMAMHNQMMADMKAMDASLDLKVAVMNAAKGREKVEATAAVINEMVAQQKQMMAKMMGIHEQMMKGIDDKSTDAHKEHHE